MADIYDNDAYDFREAERDQQERGAGQNDLEFNSFYQRQFETTQNTMLHSGNQKQMFTNITVTVYVPVKASMIGTKFDLEDVLDDEPEKLEQMQYYVR
jgi:hypothetical protein